ncbi:MAG: phospholipid/cholesterol/gamma-HCH transport system substrate-binding protein [Pseudonocardiales bacterium]|nr:phospholipid/cholesterol/gamma-HCH transport system substrate-binding protein [Pseudonocardiales bacterium]MDT7620367.1 phospholipid/cholesterol/gamma-HCH transport system substrate-binding protein [Pseudonocardiales bacterium]MDT7630594.1 phospholipid/cholesterol/gamma-HCH transport system substrate-binding protein [Pseudonocardiales bacterium]MDT7638869.1 phospholipid/cholesterol/gamma-HCH transport system substrate-binding protein [Pseudonocardiales bacterium]
MSRKRSVLFRVVTFGVVLLVGVAVASVAANSGNNTDVTVMADFKDAFPMQVGNEVKIAGVAVGTISDIRLDNGLAQVVMDVKSEVLPLHTDAKATITTQDLLGERYIALDRGSAAAPQLGQPAVIPAPQTNRDVDLQEVLNSVDTPTSVALAGLISTTGQGLHGNGAKTASAISALQPALHQTDQLVGILNQQNALLNRLVDNAAPVAAAVAADKGTRLDSLVGSTTQTLSVVAARQQALRDTLQQLPDSIASARATLAQVAGVSDPAANTLASIRPTTDNLKDISGELERFSDAADPALASLPPVLDRAQRLLDEARPVAENLGQHGGDLVGVADGAHGLVINAVDLRFSNLMELLKGWTLATTDYDSISHYFKAALVYSPKAAGQVGAGPVPNAPRMPVPSMPLPVGPPQPRYDQLGKPLTPPNSTERPGDPDGQSAGKPKDGATGLTPGQEDNMMTQLLGGTDR